MNRSTPLLALLLCALASAPALADPASAVHVVVLGSSTAAGTGPSHPDSAWVNRYRAALQAINPDHRVTNLALGGYTTWHIRETGLAPPPGRPGQDPARNITQALALAPDAIVVNLPSNDVAFGFTLAEQVVNYEAVRTIAAGMGVPVWFTTSQPRNLDQEGRDSLAAMVETTFGLYGWRAIDFWTGIAESNGEIREAFDSGDGIHLNDDAHRLLFERVLAKDIHRLRVLGAPVAPAPARLAIASIHPQPASGSLTVRFTLEHDADVTLELFDVRGRRVTVLDQGHRPAGSHAVRFDASATTAGLYFCVLREADGRAAGRRLAVVR